MSAASVGAGLLAGILSTLSPCVFPLLPLVIGAATSAHRSGAFWLAGGVAVSFTAAGLFIATVGFAIGLDGDLLRTASALLLMLIGAALLSSPIQARLGGAATGLGNAGDRIIRRLSPAGAKGQFVVGALLGLVWSPCAGPTLGAASLLAARRHDLGGVAAVMLAFGVGTTVPMVLVALLSRQVLLRWRGRLLAAGHVGKLAMGVSALAIGGLILSGVDRSVEAALVNASPVWLTDLTTRF
jgi:cytochrome c-type biogenesis protein